MKNQASSIWKQAIVNGLIIGGNAVLVTLVGLVEAFGDTYIINGVITFGEIILLAPLLLMIYSSVRRDSHQSRLTLLGTSMVTALVAGIVLMLFILLGTTIDMREIFVNASPALFELLMRG